MSSFMSSFLLLLLFIVVCCVSTVVESTTTTTTTTSQKKKQNRFHLNNESVVLITGGASLLGSELAMALYRTYMPAKIICMDAMANTKSWTKKNNNHPNNNNENNHGTTTTTQDDLAVIEWKRQRAFHVLQTLSSSAAGGNDGTDNGGYGDSSSGVFYRVDLRPSIPEYFDVGQVPILHHLTTYDYPNITHIVHLADTDTDTMEDDDSSVRSQVTSRTKDDVSAGMMETLLEQIVQMYELRNGTTTTTPHFVYASSYHVYDYAYGRNNRTTTSQKKYFLGETMDVTTPSSMAGASRIVDELLVNAYVETHSTDVFDSVVGLRFFSIYGPWSNPGSDLYDIAERQCITEMNNDDDEDVGDMVNGGDWNNVRDYIYIDDAVDAIMAAMQFQSTPTENDDDHDDERSGGPPVVINVGTGVGTSLQSVAEQVQDLFPSFTTTKNNKKKKTTASTTTTPTVAIADIERAKVLLGFEPRVSLQEGLVKLLSWHYDRAFPYGGGVRPPPAVTTGGTNKDEEQHLSEEEQAAILAKRNYIASQGIASCSPYDKECLRGAPIFPCASECLHEGKCTTSFYDDVLGFVRTLTKTCTTVMYTVDLNVGLTAIPSANMAISTHHSSHLEDGCNLAFVSESSNLVQRLKKDQGFSLSMTAIETFVRYSSSNPKKVLKHGFWTLVPVTTPNFETGDEDILALLPKLSPGLFFGPVTTHAIYCDPNVVFKDIPSLLQEAKMQPYRADTQGATAMLVARDRGSTKTFFGSIDDDDSPVTVSASESIQNAAYRMVRIGFIDEMSGDGFNPLLDSSWVVHTLQKEDSRLFRCDVFGEVVQWDVGTDEKAFEFIMGLHDMWSRVIETDNGSEPWWVGEGVVTVPEDYGISAASQARRLEQVVEDDKANDDGKNQNEGESEGADDIVESEGEDDKNIVMEDDGDADAVAAVDEAADQEANDGQVDAEDEDEEDANEDAADEEEDENTDDEEDDEGTGEKEQAFANDKDGEAEDAQAAVGQKQEVGAGAAGAGQQGQDDASGFLNAGSDRVDTEQEADNADQNAVDTEEGEQKEAVDDDEELNNAEDEEDEEEEDQEQGQAQVKTKQQQTDGTPDRDHSSYDTWMGVLSSTDVHYFVRIVTSSEVGATYLEDYNY